MRLKTEEEIEAAAKLFENDSRSLTKLVFPNEPVAEGDVRLAAVVLRKWLLEGLLGRLCHAAHAKPTLPALDNTACLDALPKADSINYFLTGGVRFNGTIVQGVYNSTKPSTGVSLVPAHKMFEREFTLGEFMRQKRLFYKGAYFTTEDIIKFTANKLGGAHYDLDRPGVFAKLDEAAEFMRFGGPLAPNSELPSEIYLVLEPKGSEILSGLHVEIIAAAASLVQLRINGEPFAVLNFHRSLWQRMKRKLLGSSKGGYRFHSS